MMYLGLTIKYISSKYSSSNNSFNSLFTAILCNTSRSIYPPQHHSHLHYNNSKQELWPTATLITPTIYTQLLSLIHQLQHQVNISLLTYSYVCFIVVR